MKKTIFITTLVFISTLNLFADFEISINAPLYFNYTFPSLKGENKILTSLDTGKPAKLINPHGGFNIGSGALMQIGSSYDLGNDIVNSLSLVADIGYYFQSYKLEKNLYDVYIDNSKEKFIFLHTLNLGFLFKINTYAKNEPISIGIGGGLKLPLTGLTGSIYNNDSESTEYPTYSDIKRMYEYMMIPYIKLTLDKYFYMSKRTAFILGAYLSYNIPLKYEVDVINERRNEPLIIVNKFEISSLEIGLNLGFYFGREKRKSADTNVNSI